MKGGKKKFAGGSNLDPTYQPQPDNASADGGFEEIPISDAAAAMEQYNQQQQRKLEKGKEVAQENEEEFEEGYEYYDYGEEDGEKSIYDRLYDHNHDHDHDGDGEGDGGDEELDGADERPKLDEGFYEIEAVRKKRTRKGVAQYLIKWRGWPETANTWEPLVNLQSCTDVIEAFEESLQSSKGKSGRKRKRKHGATPQPQSKKKPRLQQSLQRKQRQRSPAAAIYDAPAVKGTPIEGDLPSAPMMDSLNAVKTGKEGDPNWALVVSPQNGETAKEGHEQNLNVSVHVQQERAAPEGAAHANGVPTSVDNGRRIGARRRKSGAVKRLKPKSSSHDGADNAQDSSTIRTRLTNGNQNDGFGSSNRFDALNNPVITEIIRAIELSTSASSDNVKDIAVTFTAKRSDGTEVTVTNKFLKAHFPLLLINFYEQHLRYSPSPAE